MKETTKKCPICDYTPPEWSLPNNRITIQHIRHHITSKAKNELWDKEFDCKIKTPHLNFWRKEAKNQRIIIKIIKVYGKNI